MINVSNAFLDAIYNKDIRSFIYGVAVSLQDGTFLSLNNDAIYDGGVCIEDSVSQDSELQLGSAIINKLTLRLINFDGRYDIYDFTDARISLTIGLKINGAIESFQRGVYIVTEQDYNNSLLTLTCLDNMSLFERPYTESMLQYPASLLQIVQDACTACGVILATTDFPNCNAVIPVKPNLQGTTFRDVIAWAAQCAGCFAKVDNHGLLEIKFYDFNLLQSASDELLESWTEDIDLATESGDILITESGDNIILDRAGFSYFPYLYAINTGYNDTTITGIRVCVENPESTGADNAILEYSSGTEEYELLIENNWLITPQNAQEIADAVGSRLIGSTYRKANYTHLGDPSVTAGDVACIKDGHGNLYRTVVSSTTFTSGDRQNTVSAGANPPRVPNQPPQYSVAIRVTQDGDGRITQDGNIRSSGTLSQNTNTRMLRSAPTSSYNSVTRFSDQTRQAIRQAKAMEKLGGLYATDVYSPGGGIVHYLHNKQHLSESNIQMVVSDSGVHVTDQGLSDNPQWYGMEVDGTFIASLLQTTGINAEWIDAGAFRIYDSDGAVIFNADTDGKFDWRMLHSSLTDNGFLRLFGAYDDEESVGLVVSKTLPTGRRVEENTLKVGASGVYIDGADADDYLYSYELDGENDKRLYLDGYDSNGVEHTFMVNTDTYTDDDSSSDPGIWWDGNCLTNPSVSAISAPGTLSNFTRGSNWTANISKSGSVVVLDYYFDARFTATSDTAITLFTLSSEFRPSHDINKMCITASGTRYRLTINTSGNVQVSNQSGSSMSAVAYFGETVTWVRSA